MQYRERFLLVFTISPLKLKITFTNNTASSVFPERKTHKNNCLRWIGIINVIFCKPHLEAVYYTDWGIPWTKSLKQNLLTKRSYRTSAMSLPMGKECERANFEAAWRIFRTRCKGELNDTISLKVSALIWPNARSWKCAPATTLCTLHPSPC